MEGILDQRREGGRDMTRFQRITDKVEFHFVAFFKQSLSSPVMNKKLQTYFSYELKARVLDFEVLSLNGRSKLKCQPTN